MNIDLSCPVELYRYALPTEKQPECSFQLLILTEKPVISVQLTLCYRDQSGELQQQTERFQGLEADEQRRMTVNITPNVWSEGIKSVDVIIEKVWFDDHTVWRRGNEPLTQYNPNLLPSGKELDQLRFVAGADALSYPELQERVWLCVCGRPNALDTDRCCRCHREKAKVMESFSKENVQKLETMREETLNNKAKEALEKNSLLQEAREKQEIVKKRRRKSALHKGLFIGAILLVIALFVLFGLPALHYFSATRLLTGQKFDAARSAFSALGDYRDSATMITECDYQEAVVLRMAGDAESLESAQLRFERLGEYRDSAGLAKKTAYQLGEMYENSGLYEAAADKFASLGDYEDSHNRYLKAVYLQACKLMDGESYDAARLLFSALPDYEDAEEKEMQCGYLLAKQYITAGNWEAALTELEDLSGYEDADELVKQARYGLAEERMTMEDYEAAADFYQAAGDYQDAAAKGNECLYMMGVQEKSEENWEKAIEFFDRVSGYQDADAQVDECRYYMAKAAADAGNDELAVSYYGDDPDPVSLSENSRTLLGECHYRMAQAALDAGDRESAEAELENAATYGKAQKELNKLRYSMAEADFKDEKYEEALERYQALGNYKNCAARAKACQYALAEKALADGYFDKAIELYTLLGDYKDSETLLKDAKEKKAAALRAAGDNEGAMQLLEEAGTKAAKEMLREIYKDEGDALLEAGDYEGAVAYYTKMDNSEGKGLIKAARYHQAWAAQEEENYETAVQLYRSLGDYEDSAERLEECIHLSWGDLHEEILTMMNNKDYAGVAAVLEEQDMEELAVFYPDLPEILQEACYLQAEILYNSGKPYEAIPYYQRAGSYRKSDSDKLTRKPYLILGTWKTGDGVEAEFRVDGSCLINGEELYFKVSGYNLYTGTDPDKLSVSHRVSNLEENKLVLRDTRGEKETVYRFNREGQWSLPAMTLPTSQDKKLTEEDSDTLE